MEKQYPTLYKRAKTGKVQVWSVRQEGDKYFTTAGQKGGKLTTPLPTICKPKNVGKKNESSGTQQCTTEIEALYVKKLKDNYFLDEADIDKGFLEPQLAKPNKDHIHKVKWEKGQIVDLKLNGWACIIKMKEGRVRAFSRNEEEYFAIPHILEAVADIFKENPDAYLQGELFNRIHINRLNRIGEICAVTRKEKDMTPELLAESAEIVQFHMYDGYGFLGTTTVTKGRERRYALLDLLSERSVECLQPIIFKICFSLPEMVEYANDYITNEKGEGVIIRDPEAPYVHGRTPYLLKWKKGETAEYIVCNDPNPFVEGTGNSTGCAEAVWCENPLGTREQRFKVNLRGSKEHLREVFKNPDKYRGQGIMVDFQELSEYNVPQLPYSDLIIRDQIEGKPRKLTL